MYTEKKKFRLSDVAVAWARAFNEKQDRKKWHDHKHSLL